MLLLEPWQSLTLGGHLAGRALPCGSLPAHPQPLQAFVPRHKRHGNLDPLTHGRDIHHGRSDLLGIRKEIHGAQ